MAELIELLIPKANAQSTQIVAQPTFGTITGGGTSQTAASVLLTSDSTSAVVGESFTVDINIDTAGTEISEYRLVVDFDTDTLSVVDSDPTTPGTQIDFIDPVFVIDNIEEDNTVSNVGRIRLNVAAPTGQTFAVNKKVASITFQTQKVGTGNISVVDGVVGSQLIRSGGTSIAYTNNEIGVDVTTVAVNEPTDPTPTNPTNPTNPTDSNGNPTTPTSNPGNPLPNTALPFGIESYILLVAGILSVLISITLKAPKKPE